MIVFVIFMSGFVIINLAILTLHIRMGGLQKGQSPFSQTGIGPYRAILSYSFLLLLVLYLNGGKITLPAIDLDWGIFSQIFAQSSSIETSHHREREQPQPQPAPPTTSPPASTAPVGTEATPTTPPSPEATPPHVSIQTEGAERPKMDENRGRIPDWALGEGEEPVPIL